MQASVYHRLTFSPGKNIRQIDILLPRTIWQVAILETIWSWFREASLNLVSLFSCGEKPQTTLCLTPLQHHRGGSIKEKKNCLKTFMIKAKPTSRGHRLKESHSLDVALGLSNKRCMCFLFNISLSAAFWDHCHMHLLYARSVMVWCSILASCSSLAVLRARLPPCVWFEDKH